jgi:Bacterial type II and III secretion system protein
VKSHFAVAAVLVAALMAPVRAQEQTPPTAPTTTSTLKVLVILSRYQGEKKISSLPYTLTVNVPDVSVRNPFGRANLRLGTQVPITTMSRQNGDANAPMVPSVQYKDVGTNIDCTITAYDGGRFKLDVTLEDSSVDMAPTSGANTTHPAFRSFRTSDTLMLRDGQSAQFSTATDKVSSDVWKVDVTLNVVK